MSKPFSWSHLNAIVAAVTVCHSAVVRECPSEFISCHLIHFPLPLSFVFSCSLMISSLSVLFTSLHTVYRTSVFFFYLCVSFAFLPLQFCVADPIVTLRSTPILLKWFLKSHLPKARGLYATHQMTFPLDESKINMISSMMSMDSSGYISLQIGWPFSP